MPPIRAFNAGDIYAHWESAEVNNNTKADIENVEAPINTTYKHIITQMSITGERKRMLCHSKLLVSESISGRTGVFVVWFIPTVEYTETHTGNPAKEFGNDGNMGDYCGLKVYSRLNGSIIRINKYNDGKKIAGVYFPNAKTKLARLSAKTYGDKLLAGISFTMFTKKSSGTRGYDWDEECYDNEMDEDEGGEEEEIPEEGDPDVDFFDEEFDYCYGELEEEIPWDCGELTPAIIVEEIEAEEEELEEVEEVEEIPDEEAFDPNDGVEEEIEELPEDCEEECEEAEWDFNKELERLTQREKTIVHNLYKKWKILTPSEKEFVLNHLIVAIRFYENSNLALSRSRELYPGSNLGLNDTRDAFRHAFWSALNAYYYGTDLAREYGNAHEDREQSEEEKNMDIHNNNIGFEIGEKAREYDWDESQIEQAVLDAINEGKAIVLK